MSLVSSHHVIKTRTAARQRGVTLIVTMMMLLVLTILGLGLYQFSTQDERSARNEADRQIALQAAELALRDAEMDLQCQRLVGGAYAFCTPGTNVVPGDPNSSMCRNTCVVGSTLKDPSRRLTGFDAACTGGFCAFVAGDGTKPPWEKPFIGTSPLENPASSVALGAQTGAQALAATSTPPRYLIEGIDNNNRLIYRITAKGWGANPSTTVTLQEIYRP